MYEIVRFDPLWILLGICNIYSGKKLWKVDEVTAESGELVAQILHIVYIGTTVPYSRLS